MRPTSHNSQRLTPNQPSLRPSEIGAQMQGRPLLAVGNQQRRLEPSNEELKKASRFSAMLNDVDL